MSKPGLTTQEVNLDGHRYRITKLPGMTAYKLSPRLLDKLGGVFVAFANAAGKGGDIKMSPEDFLSVLPEFVQVFSRTSPDELEEITRAVFAGVHVVLGGKLFPLMDVFDDHFQGRTMSIYKLMGQAIRINFFDFGEGRGVFGTAPQTSTPPQSETLDTSAGPPSA